jgi:hypothetical protein
MKIFISWSGERSKLAAAAFHEWLPLVLHYADPWMSEMDIESGSRGMKKISEELDGRNFGIICITPENLRAPWINFEAGALSKSVEEGRVVPLLLGMDAKDVPPPLGQFQAKRIDKSGIKALVADINKACPNQIEDAKLTTLFERLWDDIETKISNIPAAPGAESVPRKEGEILEELVTGMRSIDSKFRDFSMETIDRMTRAPRRSKRLHPMMIMDAAEMFMDRPGDPIFLLVMSGLIREEVPWLSEILTESYREIRSGSIAQIEAASMRLRRLMKQMDRGHPMFRELMGESKESHMLLMEIPHIVDRALARYSDSLEKDDVEDLI